MWYRRIKRLLLAKGRRPLPGNSQVSVGRFCTLLFESLNEGQIRTRSSAIAFQVLLAAPPALYFLFTLLPYVPVANLEEESLRMLSQMLPQLTFRTIEPFVRSLFIGRGVAPFVGLAISLLIASNGVDNVVDAFHATAQEVESRPFLHRRLLSFLLVLAIALLTVTATVLIVLGRIFSFRVAAAVTDSGAISTDLLELGTKLVVVVLVYLAVSLLYFYAPADRPRWRAVSIGSISATVFVLVASWGFSFYLRHIGQLNRLFGSLGTLMALMIWLKLVALAVLVGFELNVSLENVGSRSPPIQEPPEQPPPES